MRDILFRGKRIDNGEWVYGCLLYDSEQHEAYIAECFEDKSAYIRSVIPLTVGQYTGLTDKNGKKIFEGDILLIAKKSDWTGNHYYPPLAYPVNVIVKWDMCAWMWETLTDDKRYLGFPDAWCHYECEYVSNIHDIPELLKGGEGK